MDRIRYFSRSGNAAHAPHGERPTYASHANHSPPHAHGIAARGAATIENRKSKIENGGRQAVLAPRNSRSIAARLLMRWLMTHEFASGLLPDGVDRAFVQDMVYTALRRLRPLRLVLGELMSHWPKGEMEALLYIGAAQILYMPDVPDFAAVHETVEAAKLCENPAVFRVVNAVLRALLRRREEMVSLIASSDPDVRESMPRALWKRWAQRLGEEKALKLAEWHNTPAVTTLAYPDGRFEQLARGERVEAQKGFAEGEFIVQDPATALAVELVEPHAGEKILDACAAPGGKCIQLAWRLADVTACEVNPSRRMRLEQNLARTKLSTRVKILSSLPAGAELFDKVLVDAPCTNSGVLRRRPDARWNWSEERLLAAAKLQAKILDECAKCVKRGGRLVYSTCSNEPEENEQQVADFLARHKDFSLVAQKESLPVDSGMDGAFAAAFIRSAAE